jgi:hypothetical protein
VRQEADGHGPCLGQRLDLNAVSVMTSSESSYVVAARTTVSAGGVPPGFSTCQCDIVCHGRSPGEFNSRTREKRSSRYLSVADGIRSHAP